MCVSCQCGPEVHADPGGRRIVAWSGVDRSYVTALGRGRVKMFWWDVLVRLNERETADGDEDEAEDGGAEVYGRSGADSDAISRGSSALYGL